METTLEELHDGLRLACAEVLALLRSEPDVQALTPGGEWTVRDTAVHLTVVPRLYIGTVNGQPLPFAASAVQAFNAGAFLALDEVEANALADLYERAVESYISAASAHGRDDPCPYYVEVGGQATVGALSTILTSESLLHGADMARAVGRLWSRPESAAEKVFATMMAMVLPYCFAPQAAGDLDAVFTIESPGGRLPYQVRSGTIEPLDEDAAPDCSISGTASEWLLWLTGRADWADVDLSATGRRADLAPLFAGLFPVRQM